MIDDERAGVHALQMQVMELKHLVDDLTTLLAERDARIRQLLLAEALRQWKPPRKRAGAPKRINKADDLMWLHRLDQVMRELHIKDRTKALDYLIELGLQLRREQGLPRLNATDVARQRRTFLNRMADVAPKKSSR